MCEVLKIDVRQKIKSLMEKKNMSIYALAQKADLTTACISNWYSKRDYLPSVDALEKVCTALEISMAELFCNDDETMVPVDTQRLMLLKEWDVLNALQRDAIICMIQSFTHKQ